MSSIVSRTLSCGAQLVHEHIPAAGSVAVRIMVPVGGASDPVGAVGRAAMLSEYVFRGAGELDSRGLSEALDRCGVDRSCTAGAHRMVFGATMLASQFENGMDLVLDMVRRPTMPDDALEPVRRLCLQAIDGMEDDPQHLVMLRLRERANPAPFDRHGYGDADDIAGMSASDLRDAWAERCVPEGAIISVAGGVAVEHVEARLEAWLRGWSGAASEPDVSAEALRGVRHIEQESAQVHLAVAWDAPPEGSPDAILERLSNAVLSGSTSGRLFSEVRAKRSLCYSVGASYAAGRDRGLVSLYAGTTPERAQETLDVCIGEIHRMSEGITDDEFRRAVIGLKSRVVMQGESTPARASALASDQFRLGRPRSLEEVMAAIDAVDLDRLQAYVAERTPGPFTVVSIGPRPVTPPSG
ncbi:MAG: M16 family metallopeptidase [Phycisphaerales bacterium]